MSARLLFLDREEDDSGYMEDKKRERTPLLRFPPPSPR
jgi:hypothetical protein